MTYSSGGLIQATDYNTFVGTNPVNTSGVLNSVWGTGNGNAGYGQSAVSQSAAAGGTVTATQWSSLINTLNNVYRHQSGSNSALSAVSTGDTVTYLSSLSGALTTIYTNRLTAASQGTTTTGATFSPAFSVGNTYAAQTWTFTRTIAFASGNAARYFFNAGGQLNFVTISAVNNDSSGRSGDWVTLIGSNLVNISAIKQGSNGGKSGTGGTVNTNNTALGYWSSTTTAQTIADITSTTYTYTGDYVRVAIRTSAANASGNGDNGSTVYLDFTVYSQNHDSLHLFNQTLNVTWNHRIDVVYPETTNLTSTWGTATIS